MRFKRQSFPGISLACSLMSSAQAQPASIPAALSSPGDQVVLSVQVQGVQVYDCKRVDGKLVWVYTGPRAPLTKDGAVIGRFFTGPTWQLNDGSAVTGKVAASAPPDNPNNYPWQRFQVTSRGQGQLEGVNAVVQVNTIGGVLTGTCIELGIVAGEPFYATYHFIKS